MLGYAHDTRRSSKLECPSPCEVPWCVSEARMGVSRLQPRMHLGRQMRWSLREGGTGRSGESQPAGVM